jgi:hypothetical protein
VEADAIDSKARMHRPKSLSTSTASTALLECGYGPSRATMDRSPASYQEQYRWSKEAGVASLYQSVNQEVPKEFLWTTSIEKALKEARAEDINL